MIPIAIIVNGDTRCPNGKCNAMIITPIERNPYNGNVEKMILVPWVPAPCPLCKEEYMVDELQAHIHNKFWYENESR